MPPAPSPPRTRRRPAALSSAPPPAERRGGPVCPSPPVADEAVVVRRPPSPRDPLLREGVPGPAVRIVRRPGARWPPLRQGPAPGAAERGGGSRHRDGTPRRGAGPAVPGRSHVPPPPAEGVRHGRSPMERRRPGRKAPAGNTPARSARVGVRHPVIGFRAPPERDPCQRRKRALRSPAARSTGEAVRRARPSAFSAPASRGRPRARRPGRYLRHRWCVRTRRAPVPALRGTLFRLGLRGDRAPGGPRRRRHSPAGRGGPPGARPRPAARPSHSALSRLGRTIRLPGPDRTGPGPCARPSR